MSIPLQNVVLPLNCQHCGGAVGVACEVQPDGWQTVRFRCPYCEWPREYQAPGRVIRIATLSPHEGPAQRH